jgi:hypothetical protein
MNVCVDLINVCVCTAFTHHHLDGTYVCACVRCVHTCVCVQSFFLLALHSTGDIQNLYLPTTGTSRQPIVVLWYMNVHV